MLKFLFLVNKQGQTRLSQYYEYIKLEDRSSLEAEIVRKCLTRNEDQVNVLSTFIVNLFFLYNVNPFWFLLSHSALSWSIRTSKLFIEDMRRCILLLGLILPR